MRSNYEHIRDIFDEIIKKSVEIEMSDNNDSITDDEVMENRFPLPPADMYDRIVKECNNSTADLKMSAKNECQTHRKRKPRKAVIIAAAIMVLSLSALSVSAVRVYVFRIIHQITDSSIQFFSINEESYSYESDEADAYNNADKTLGYITLKPTYMPTGYTFDSIKLYENDHVIMIYKNQDRIIKLTQKVKTDSTYLGETVDTKEGYTYTISTHDTIINIAEHKQLDSDVVWYSAVWNDDNLIYNISANCTKEEFEDFIKNLKYKE